MSALDISGEATVGLCNAGSLFGDARLIVVRDVDGHKDGEGRRKGGWKAADVDAIVGYLAAPAPATVLALAAEDPEGELGALWKACAKAEGVPLVRRQEAARVGRGAVPAGASCAPNPKR